jgi:hypothetical protein
MKSILPLARCVRSSWPSPRKFDNSVHLLEKMAGNVNPAGCLEGKSRAGPSPSNAHQLPISLFVDNFRLADESDRTSTPGCMEGDIDSNPRNRGLTTAGLSGAAGTYQMNLRCRSASAQPLGWDLRTPARRLGQIA